MRSYLLLPVIAFVVPASVAAEEGSPNLQVPSFVQYVHQPMTTADGLPSDGVRSVIAIAGRVYVSTDGGLATFDGESWSSTKIRGRQPVVSLETDSNDTVIVIGGQFVALPGRGATPGFAGLDPLTLTALAADAKDSWAATTQGLFRQLKEQWMPVVALNQQLTSDPEIRDMALSAGQLVVAAQDGLFQREGDVWTALVPESGTTRWALNDVRAVEFDDDGCLWFAAAQGVGCRDASGTWQLFSGAEGLPYGDFTCLDVAPDGTVWFGTTDGAISLQDSVFGYRAGRRWLLNDQVNSLSVDEHGSIWIATPAGLSCLKATEMSLREKAAFYEDEIDLRHRRTSLGYVTNATMDPAGDRSSAKPFPTDNDGQYTGLYVGAECLGYAATKDPARRERAIRGFEALAFLSEVTQGGEHPAPPGFIARAIMPIDGPDPNERDNPERDRKKQEEDRLWKVLDPRWPVSADGQWYWKTDSSSDELDGHYFAYALFYDHVAETDAEKERCREVVRRVTDHLIVHNYRLVDHDGTPTRWAHFAPEDLNDDPNWWTERGLNSLSVLTYLTIAHRVTGDQKYRDEYERLAFDHHYALNGMVMPKLQFGPGSHIQFDDKMAFMNYYHLIRYETDPKLLRMYYTSIYYYWNIEKYELNPFFNFVYAACCHGKVRTDQWGDLDLTPGGEWLEQSVDTLKRYPMDLADWEMDNSHRLDIVPLPDHVRDPGGNAGKGFRVNGYVLPVDERQSLSWSEDVWALKTGGEGRRLRDGCPYLLAYYMGLYHGFITE